MNTRPFTSGYINSNRFVSSVWRLEVNPLTYRQIFVDNRELFGTERWTSFRRVLSGPVILSVFLAICLLGVLAKPAPAAKPSDPSGAFIYTR